MNASLRLHVIINTMRETLLTKQKGDRHSRRLLPLLLLLCLVEAANAQITIILPSTTNIQASADDGSVGLNWTAQSAWTANLDVDWLSFKFTSGFRGSYGIYPLSWDFNPTTQSRIGHLTLGDVVFTVTQAGNSIEWLEAKFSDYGSQYSIFYTQQYSQDVVKAQSWIDLGLVMMQSRYKLDSLPHGMRLFLHPVPAYEVDTNTAYTGYPTTSLGVVPSIHYLTPSSPLWLTAGKGSIGNDKNTDDYHAFITVHEFTHVVQSVLRPNWGYPAWVYEGMANYEGLFNSTAYNRDHAPDWVAVWIKANAQTIICCQSLAGEGFDITEVYNSPSFFWYFITNTYGSDINRQVYIASTNDPVTALEAATSVKSVSDLFCHLLLTFFANGTTTPSAAACRGGVREPWPPRR